MTEQLVASVRHRLFLTERDEKTEQSRRDRWEAAGVEIIEPDVYDAGVHLLEWFWEMDSLCGSNGFGGMVPLDAMRIQAWQAVTGAAIEPWEGRILLEMSRARQQGPEEAFQTDAPAGQGINAAIFDALLG